MYKVMNKRINRKIASLAKKKLIHMQTVLNSRVAVVINLCLLR